MKALFFETPRRVAVRTIELPPPGPGEVRVRARCSAVSAGTELLAYRGLLPASLPIDQSLPALTGTFAFPFRYGYALVGEVTEVGEGVAERMVGRRVFAFAPHATEVNVALAGVTPLPDDLSDERALFIANTETAVSLLHDGQPCIGERVAVFGQGIVGLLTTSLLARLPLQALAVVEPDPARAALEAGAPLAVHGAPAEPVDLAFELSGDPAALQTAIDHCGPEGRVVVGAWYGDKDVMLNLGRHFHRARVRLISSQVSTLRGELQPRWTHARRLELAVSLLARLEPERWISHRVPFEQAAQAYRSLDESPGSCLQIVLTY